MTAAAPAAAAVAAAAAAAAVAEGIDGSSLAQAALQHLVETAVIALEGGQGTASPSNISLC